jgi:hypothetical protein
MRTGLARRLHFSSPFSISNPEDRVLFIKRTCMCLVRAMNIYSGNPG